MRGRGGARSSAQRRRVLVRDSRGWNSVLTGAARARRGWAEWHGEDSATPSMERRGSVAAKARRGCASSAK